MGVRPIDRVLVGSGRERALLQTGIVAQALSQPADVAILLPLIAMAHRLKKAALRLTKQVAETLQEKQRVDVTPVVVRVVAEERAQPRQEHLLEALGRVVALPKEGLLVGVAARRVAVNITASMTMTESPCHEIRLQALS